MAPMTAAIFRAELFKEIGMLDEGFGSYLEDVDFGLRCAIAGRKGIYAHGAISYHLGSATWGTWNKDTVGRISRNQILLVKKHFGGMAKWRIVAGQLLWGLVAFRHGRGFSYLKGKLEGFSTKVVAGSGVAAGVFAQAVIKASEREIFELQTQTGFDPYWRAYFWLSRQ